MRLLCPAASIASFSPSAIPAASGQNISVVGNSMPNVASDSFAFIVAVSCSSPSMNSPNILPSTSSSSVWNSAMSISLTVNTSGAPAGVYHLCVRWNPVSPYFEAGVFDIVSVTSLTPNLIGSISSVQSIGLIGAGLVNVSGDAQAFVISTSSSTCSVVPLTSVNSVFSNSTALTLYVSDYGAAAGVYPLWLRTSSSTSYFASGLNITIGE